MTFVFPLLLGGLLLAGLPVLLHFLIRKKPKTLLFPAFRFLIQKRRSNTRNLRLKHLLLLLLRMALIVLVCLALSRPRVLHESLGLSREKPVAMVLIFDTSPSMEYKSGDLTRLDLAKKRCLELLDQLPEDGRILILDTSDSASFAREDWLKSVEKARQRVQSLTIRPDHVPVTKALAEAYRRFDKFDDAAADGMPRFVCIFSDRTRASWDFSAGAKRKSEQPVNVLYFDVGIDEPVDFAITQVDMPGNRQSFKDGEMIPLRVVVKATGKHITNNGTLLVQIGKESMVQPFPVENDKEQTLTLEFDTWKRRLGPGLHQAEVKLVPDKDSLSFNNVRYLTFEIQQKQKILVLTDDAKQAGIFVHELQRNLYEPDVRSAQGPFDFADYAAVFLHGVPKPSEKLWATLEVYVQQGGGVGIVPPGDELQASAYNNGPATSVMPARIGMKMSTPEGSIWSAGPKELDHSFLRRYQSWFDGDYDVSKQPRRAYHYWEVIAAKDAVVIPYDNNAPAVVERLWPTSGGKVLLLTTPMLLKTTWNDYYPLSSPPSFFVGLTKLCASHLCKEPAESVFNYQFGAEPPVYNKSQPFAKYLLTSGDASEEIRFDEKDQRWVGDRLPRAGNYTLSGTNPGQTKVLHKFSINVPGGESDLTRVPIGDLEAVLGKDAVLPMDRKAPLIDTLSWDEPLELFPWLMIAVLFLLALESLLANRFYRSEPAGEATA